MANHRDPEAPVTQAECEVRHSENAASAKNAALKAWVALGCLSALVVLTGINITQTWTVGHEAELRSTAAIDAATAVKTDLRVTMATQDQVNGKLLDALSDIKTEQKAQRQLLESCIRTQKPDRN